MRNKLILLLSLFLCSLLIAQNDLKIIQSTGSYALIEYIPQYLDTVQQQVNSQTYINVILQNGSEPSFDAVGLPSLPYRSITLGVPSETGNTIQIIDSDYNSINGKYLPVAKMVRREGFAAYEIEESVDYSKNSFGDLVSFGDFGMIRELPSQQIIVNPVQFDGGSGEIRLYNKILFRINYVSVSGSRERIKENYFGNIIPNFDVSRNWGLAKEKTLRKANVSAVLSSGKWFRFNITDEGIYKIDRAKLAAYGIDPASVDPRTIKIYNNGGHLLPEVVTAERPVDLVENAIYIAGEDDGSFDESDYILFYGRGIKFWDHDSEARYTRNRHWYSKENYYWITAGGSPGKRMEDKQSLNTTAVEQNSTKAFITFEEDKINLIKSGRECYGDQFSSSDKSRTYVNMLNNLVPNTPVKYEFGFVNYSGTPRYSSVPFTLEDNGTVLFQGNLSGGNDQYLFGRYHRRYGTHAGNLSGNRSNLKFTFDTDKSDVFGYLDYFTIEYEAALRAVDNELIFFSPNVNQTTEYTLTNFSNTYIDVFDITDYSNVKIVQVPSGWKSGGQITFQAEETAENVKKYIAVNNNKHRIPGDGVEVANSFIRSDMSGVEYILITPKEFVQEAERLATYRRTSAPHKISSKVYLIDNIFNEFSGGNYDPAAIRDFIKFAYDNWNTKPQYICLFGDGDYDYFNLDGHSANFIPSYQTQESLDELASFPYDDFYARISGNDKSVDIALGRLPVRTNQDAINIVDKIIFYETQSEKGLWRNSITLVADDAWTTERDGETMHTVDSEDLAKTKIPAYFDQNKIYLANYPVVTTGSGRRKPGVNDAIVNAINSGTLILNYIGHGNPKIWAHEVVFDREINIPLLDNDKYFFLSAATCDYGRFDDPELQSATEEMLLLKDRGMIGGYSASRPVYAGKNHLLNSEFYKNLFKRDDNGYSVPLGVVYFWTKAVKSGDNDAKYQLFCDPALRLAEPQHEAIIDSLNGSIPNTSLQLSALSNSSIKGSIRNNDGSLNKDFTGEGIITVLDSKRLVELEEINGFKMEQSGGVIFRGRVSVNNGEFATSFTVPKDISYEDNQGKIIAYFFDDKNDGIGFTEQFRVGGTNPNAKNDGAGPEIEIYYDDLSFTNSYLVNPNFNLLVRLKDETGLNTTGTGVGHKLEGILNDDDANAIDFSNYFVGDLDAGGKSGMIDYQFSALDPGDYKIRIKAWDVFNNVSIEESHFTVVSDDELVIQNVVNYPNPFTSSTHFTFQHNLTEPINVKIKVYTIAGRLIKEIENDGIIDKFVKIPWDGRDENGDVIANGTYLYKLIVKATEGDFSENILGKLAIIR